MRLGKSVPLGDRGQQRAQRGPERRVVGPFEQLVGDLLAAAAPGGGGGGRVERAGGPPAAGGASGAGWRCVPAGPRRAVAQSAWPCFRDQGRRRPRAVARGPAGVTAPRSRLLQAPWPGQRVPELARWWGSD